MITRTPENNPEWAKRYAEEWGEEPPVMQCVTRCAEIQVDETGVVSTYVNSAPFESTLDATPADLADVALAFLTIADKLTTIKENRECR